MTNHFRFALTYEGLEDTKPALVSWYGSSTGPAIDFLLSDEEVSGLKLVSMNGTLMEEVIK